MKQNVDLKILSDQKRSWWRLEYAFIGAGALLALIYLYAQWDPISVSLLIHLDASALAFLAFAISAYTLQRAEFRRGDLSQRVCIGYSLGMLLWFLGEFTWAFYSYVLGVADPFPSIGDAFWLAGYFPLAYALIRTAWPFREGFSSRNLVIVTSLAAVLSAIVLGVLIPSIVEGGDSILEVSIGVAYPLLDILLLMIALPVFYFFMKGDLWRPFSLVMGGIILNLIADVVFALAEMTGTYYAAHPLNLVYDWGYLAFALGFHLRLRQAVTLRG